MMIMWMMMVMIMRGNIKESIENSLQLDFASILPLGHTYTWMDGHPVRSIGGFVDGSVSLSGSI